MTIYDESEFKRVRLTRMEDPYTKLIKDDMGWVTGIDDSGKLLVRWDKGSSLSLIPGVDEYEIVERLKTKFLKCFEEFHQNNLDVVSTKLQELQDIIPSGTDFGYKLNQNVEDSQFEGSVIINLDIFEQDLEFRWSIDLDTPRICLYKNSQEIYDQKVSSIDEALDILEKNLHKICGITERVKAQRYKGRKIPGKYLTKNPSKMKKEIDRYVGKKEYKKDWDADYKSGKGGVGKRVKTKKSAATKAYQKMFGNK